MITQSLTHMKYLIRSNEEMDRLINGGKGLSTPLQIYTSLTGDDTHFIPNC